MKGKFSKLTKKLGAMLIAAVMMMAMLVPAAFAANEAVNQDANGVFTIEYCLYDNNNSVVYSQVGSGFLINEDTLLTCHHVVHVWDDELRAVLNEYDRDWERKMQIRVIYQNGNAYTAKEIPEIANQKCDFTAIKIVNATINNRTILQISDVPVQKTDEVYALGFPYVNTVYEDAKSSTYSPIDVSAKEAKVTKNAVEMEGVEYINHDAETPPGMSGGPLVNEAGAVVGINAQRISNENIGYAVAISQVREALDTTGTIYTLAGGSVSTEPEPSEGGEDEPTEPAEVDYVELNANLERAQSYLNDADSYTEESIAKLNSAVEAGKAVVDNAADQAQADSAAKEIKTAIDGMQQAKKGMSTGLIIGIVAGVVVVIIIIVVVLSTRKKKGNDDRREPQHQTAPQQPAAPNYSAPQGFNGAAPQPAPNFRASAASAQPTGVLNTGAGETSVLNTGAGETSVLTAQPYGILTRKKNGQSIQINAQTFVIGKERSKVTYCIEMNNSISRTHAQIVKSAGGASIIDMGSKNGTFVNGIKCAPNVPVTLKTGDTIQLADEEFTFQAL